MSSILVIDDDQKVRNMLKQSLTREGYDVLVAEDGNEGLKIFREKGADLVITDLIMPDKEGIEIIVELRREFPGIKIIAISGGGRIGPESYLLTAKRLGAMRTLLKPFEREELLMAVKELLD